MIKSFTALDVSTKFSALAAEATTALAVLNEHVAGKSDFDRRYNMALHAGPEGKQGVNSHYQWKIANALDALQSLDQFAQRNQAFLSIVSLVHADELQRVFDGIKPNRDFLEGTRLAGFEARYGRAKASV